MSTKFGYGFDVNLFAVGANGGETLCSSDGCLTAIPVFDRLRNDRGLICDGGGVLYRITTDEEIIGGEVFLRQSEEGIVLSGYASMIPLFSEYIEAKTRVSAMKGNPWQFVRTTEDQQRALMSVASEFAVAIGLSERSND